MNTTRRPDPYLPSTDVSKLHSEINQLVQQRFVLASAILTFLAGLFTLTLKVDAEKSLPAQLYRCAGLVIAYQVLVLITFRQSKNLWYRLRTYSTYLRVTDSSRWEDDWARLRDWFKKTGSTELKGYERDWIRGLGRLVMECDLRAHRSIFFCASVIGGLIYPLVLLSAALTADRFDYTESTPWVLLAIVATTTVTISTHIWVQGIDDARDFEDDVEKQWMKILKPPIPPTADGHPRIKTL
jgi:hypothetical protein